MIIEVSETFKERFKGFQEVSAALQMSQGDFMGVSMGLWVSTVFLEESHEPFEVISSGFRGVSRRFREFQKVSGAI